MPGRQTCMDCGRTSPETHGEITLTTSLGWRIRRAQLPSGETTLEWRCPACWQKFKAARDTTSEPPPAPSLAPPSSKLPRRQ